MMIIALLVIKQRYQKYNGTLDDADIHSGHIIYKCRNCGEEWI